MEHESNCDTNYYWCTWNNPSKISKETGNKRTSGDHPDYKIIKISQNTKKRAGDLR